MAVVLGDYMDILGYDPGGKGTNGVARVSLDQTGKIRAVDAESCSTSDDAQTWLECRSVGVDALAIDTLLAWTHGQRDLDRSLRARYGLPSGSVQSAGSLRGAMLVNGVLVARHFMGQLSLFEVNPKATLRSVANAMQNEYTQICDVYSEHAADAALGAWVVGQWMLGVWKFDLFKVFDQNLYFPAGDAIFPWPDEFGPDILGD
ncbi:MAG: hypothetical protein Alpg2KO_11100 [Alphaproteobacteria bacterium]